MSNGVAVGKAKRLGPGSTLVQLIYVLLSLSTIGLSACAPAWTRNSAHFSGHNFSYVIGDGYGPTRGQARRNAELQARFETKQTKARQRAIGFNEIGLSDALDGGRLEVSARVDSLLQELDIFEESNGADVASSNLGATTVNGDSRPNRNINNSSRQILISMSNDQPILGWTDYRDKEHEERVSVDDCAPYTERMSSDDECFRIRKVFQFQPDSTGGTYIVNRTPAEFPGMRPVPGLADFMWRNMLIPGLGTLEMGHEKRGIAYMVSYAASWVGWAGVWYSRNQKIRALKESRNAIEEAELVQSVNHRGNMMNRLVGVAAITFVSSFLENLFTTDGLFVFSPTGGARGIELGINVR